MDAITYRTVHANDLEFNVAVLGSGTRLALCLHGFPECSFSWRYQMPLLARLGFLVQTLLIGHDWGALTLMLWGEVDAALGKELTYGTERYVSDLTLRYLPNVSHWVQQEAPETVNLLLQAWLAGVAVPMAPGATPLSA